MSIESLEDLKNRLGSIDGQNYTTQTALIDVVYTIIEHERKTKETNALAEERAQKNLMDINNAISKLQASIENIKRNIQQHEEQEINHLECRHEFMAVGEGKRFFGGNIVFEDCKKCRIRRSFDGNQFQYIK